VSKAWEGGSTRRWRNLRARILEANRMEHGGLCQIAVQGVCTGQADQVHHTQGRAATGDDPRYLMAACRACNLHVGQPNRRSPKPTPTSSW
jgi:hypothetical protein